MDPFFAQVEKFFKTGKGFIPSEQKGVFVTLFFAMFATITGVGIVVPLLPIYAHDLGASGIYVGMIFGSFSISRTLLLPYFGRLSDQKGRKPLIAVGLLFYTLISFAFIFSKNVDALIILRFIQGAASAMVMPVVQAYVGDITPEGSEGYAMGLFNLSMFLSLSLGPMMGGTIKDILSLDAAFVSMGVLSGIGLLMCMFLLPPVSMERSGKAKPAVIPWTVLMKDKTVFAIFMFRYTYIACIGVIWSFLPLYADKKFGLSGALTGLLVTLGVFVSGLLQVPMGAAADRMSRSGMIMIGGLFSAAGMLMPYFASSFSDLVVAVCVFGFGGGMSMPAVMASAVLKGEEKKAMGAVMSMMTLAHSLGFLTGSMAAGLAMDFSDLKMSFPSGALIMLAGTFVVFWAAVRKIKI